MRPQPEGCGERRVAPSWVWDARLQCGHSPKAVENKIGFVESLSRRSASMRPQPEGRGEPTQAASSGPSWSASMRPQPEGRGEPGRAGRVWTQHASFNAATARRPWRTIAALAALAATAGFNAATARRPWRTPFGLDDSAGGTTLQCGHSPKAVENLIHPGRSLSNSRELQCGHSPKAVENQMADQDSHGQRELQCGHSPKAVENANPGTDTRHNPTGFNAATARRLWRTELM